MTGAADLNAEEWDQTEPGPRPARNAGAAAWRRKMRGVEATPAKICPECGDAMQRHGANWTCQTCKFIEEGT